MSGLDVMENSLAVRRKIGYLPENVPLYLDMTVREYLTFVAEIKGTGRSERNGETDRVIEACQLGDVRDRFIKKLSKGYRQRTGLAQALIGDPEVLILDEPTIGLDPKQIHEIRTLIKSMAGRKTIILSTHILPEVAMICDTVAIISQGRVLAQDTPQNLIKSMPEAGKIRLRVNGPSIDVKTALLDLPAVREVTSFPDRNTLLVDGNEEACPLIARTIAESGWELHEMTPLKATLEDVFIRLVTADQEGAAHG